MRERYDVIIVGTGPAGIFAARELVDAVLDVLLVNKGKSLQERRCPLKQGLVPQCIHCRPCSVICGWGGAGAFSDGKLTLTPEFGGNLERYIGRSRLLELIDAVDAVYVGYGADMPVFSPDGDFAREIARRGRTT
ncbi:MAG: FAD-dependent oxidoreductase, partial [Synergistales bacterium]|nr:FAD-dependent oxidoreductase [Synergistales bacterium]